MMLEYCRVHGTCTKISVRVLQISCQMPCFHAGHENFIVYEYAHPRSNQDGHVLVPRVVRVPDRV